MRTPGALDRRRRGPRHATGDDNDNVILGREAPASRRGGRQRHLDAVGCDVPRGTGDDVIMAETRRTTHAMRGRLSASLAASGRT